MAKSIKAALLMVAVVNVVGCAGGTRAAVQAASGCSAVVAVVPGPSADVGVSSVKAYVLERGWLAAQEDAKFIVAASKPALRNAHQVQTTILRRYPPELRNAGIGGTALMRLLVDTSGRVAHSAVLKSSGQPQLDRVALETARDMRFDPYTAEGCVHPVVLAVPIQFWTQ